MLVARQVFQAKYGRGDELAPQVRILTDASGPFFSVVTETEVESFAAWEKGFSEAMNQPWIGEWFSRMTEPGRVCNPYRVGFRLPPRPPLTRPTPQPTGQNGTAGSVPFCHFVCVGSWAGGYRRRPPLSLPWSGAPASSGASPLGATCPSQRPATCHSGGR